MSSVPPSVSGPGRLARRTDLSPVEQPIRTPTGMPYGEAGALEQQQRAAPMQAAGAPTGGGPVPAWMQGGAFGPTQRPGDQYDPPELTQPRTRPARQRCPSSRP